MKPTTANEANVMDDEELRFKTQILLHAASDHFKAYMTLTEKFPGFSVLFHIKYFHVCRSLELSMKGYLRESGLTKKEIVDFSHNLEKLMYAVIEKGVEISPDFQEAIKLANVTYKAKDLEYPEMGSKIVPELESLASPADLILRMATSKLMSERRIMPKGEDVS